MGDGKEMEIVRICPLDLGCIGLFVDPFRDVPVPAPEDEAEYTEIGFPGDEHRLNLEIIDQ